MGSDTKQRILDIAERLFAENGYAATSLRDITSAARVNLAAVHYHFGSKEALAQAVIGRRLTPLNEARLKALDELERAGGRDLTVADIVAAFIAPALKLSRERGRGGSLFLRLQGSALSNPSKRLTKFLKRQYREVLRRYEEALQRALPDMPPQEVAWRMHFMLGAMTYTMAATDALRFITASSAKAVSDAEAITARLVPFLTAGLTAPLPPAPADRAA